jgi:folate-binding protein YgfZ
MTQHSSYDAARSAAAMIARRDRGWIVVSGEDRRQYLHGLLTNDVAALSTGQGCYAAYLTPQGRMIADLWVYELGDVILLAVWRDVKDTVLAKLDQFIFSEDVKLGDVSDAFAGVAVVGPDAARVVAAALGGETTPDMLSRLAEHGNVRVPFAGQPAIVLRTTDLGEPGFDVLVEIAAREPLVSALASAGAVEIGEAAAETIRIEAGVPKFHRDMDEETIPLEAGIESRAISMTKGCYVGQEVIVRVLHRGHGRVARRLVGLVLDQTPATAGTPVQAPDGRDIGTVTSSTISPALQKPIALAYLHRDFVTPGTAVTVAGSPAQVSVLPFVGRPGL